PWSTCAWIYTRRPSPSSAGWPTRTFRWCRTTTCARAIPTCRRPRNGSQATDKGPAVLLGGLQVVSLARCSREHGEGLVERADAGVHLHRLVETVGVSRGVAAPAALADDDGVEVHAEGLAHAGLDAAVGGAAADDERRPAQQPEQLGRAGAVEGARPALEVDVVLGTRRDLVREAGVRGTLDTVGERRY